MHERVAHHLLEVQVQSSSNQVRPRHAWVVTRYSTVHETQRLLAGHVWCSAGL
jgi:hypothetical protein